MSSVAAACRVSDTKILWEGIIAGMLTPAAAAFAVGLVTLVHAAASSAQCGPTAGGAKCPGECAGAEEWPRSGGACVEVGSRLVQR